jgi:hypothetical protein
MDWTDDLLLFSDVMADDASCYVTAHTTEESSLEHCCCLFLSFKKSARAITVGLTGLRTILMNIHSTFTSHPQTRHYYFATHSSSWMNICGFIIELDFSND